MSSCGGDNNIAELQANAESDYLQQTVRQTKRLLLEEKSESGCISDALIEYSIQDRDVSACVRLENCFLSRTLIRYAISQQKQTLVSSSSPPSSVNTFFLRTGDVIH